MTAQDGTKSPAVQALDARTGDLWFVSASAPGVEAFCQFGCVAVNFLVRTSAAERLDARQLTPDIVDPQWETKNRSTRTRFVNQLAAFASIAPGDIVVTFDRRDRNRIEIGQVTGAYRYDAGFSVAGHPHVHEVQWLGPVSRDHMSALGLALPSNPSTTVKKLTETAIEDPSRPRPQPHRARDTRKRQSVDATEAYPRRPPRPDRRRIILSRKGFDGDWGGKPSPILPDDRMVSLPIPDPEGARRYSDGAVAGFGTYLDLLLALGIDAVWAPKTQGRKLATTATLEAHLDPDLRHATLDRQEGWRPLFGQKDDAQRELVDRGVQAGDLFLYFGWFARYVPDHNGRLRRIVPDLHVIWGWLEISDIRSVNGDEIWPWAHDHPHYASRNLQRYAKRNTLYAAAETPCSWAATSVASAGVFSHFHEDLVLTAEGCTRSKWRLPMAFHPDNTWSPLGYHAQSDLWSEADGFARLDTWGRCQELVVEANEGIEEWVASLFALV